ncbi:MAG: hypothetical protein JW885_08175 [Deltaproteobacteria bacterium]|nr:hypothetical protein [Candidatus Zymogenaceae bacterium]
MITGRVKPIVFVFLLLIAWVVPGVASAEWNGIIPNVSTKTEVIEILGEPSMDSGTIMVYDGVCAPCGTKGAAVYYINDIVVMVRVIPLSGLTPSDLTGQYGSPVDVSENHQAEEYLFDSTTGSVKVLFIKRSNTAIRIDYL